MSVRRRRAASCALLLVVAFAASGNCCPELRACFPEQIVQLPCESNNGAVWSPEPSRTDCSMYLNCLNGIGVQNCCDVGEYFNPITQACDDAENVECDIVPPPCPEVPTVDPQEPTPTTADPPTVDPEEPTSTTVDETSETTEENPATTTVETDTTTEDADSTTPESPTTEGTETTTVGEESELDALCASLPSNALAELPHPEECNKYVLCMSRALLSVETCPAGLHFNPTLNVCDSPDHAECLAYLCQNNADGQLLELPSLNSCQLHYLCVGNTTIKRLCAPGTVFVAEFGWCTPEDPDNPCQRLRPPPPPASVIEQCRDDRELSKIPHPEKCDIYYRCLNGRIYVRQCPPGLFFDNDRAQCNLEENVSCLAQE